MTTDIVLHTHIADKLPDSDPVAYTTINCYSCGKMVHAANNECMRSWVEYELHALCLKCFIDLLEDLDVIEIDDDLLDRARERRGVQ